MSFNLSSKYHFWVFGVQNPFEQLECQFIMGGILKRKKSEKNQAASQSQPELASEPESSSQPEPSSQPESSSLCSCVFNFLGPPPSKTKLERKLKTNITKMFQSVKYCRRICIGTNVLLLKHKDWNTRTPKKLHGYFLDDLRRPCFTF